MQVGVQNAPIRRFRAVVLGLSVLSLLASGTALAERGPRGPASTTSVERVERAGRLGGFKDRIARGFDKLKGALGRTITRVRGRRALRRMIRSSPELAAHHQRVQAKFDIKRRSRTTLLTAAAGLLGFGMAAAGSAIAAVPATLFGASAVGMYKATRAAKDYALAETALHALQKQEMKLEGPARAFALETFRRREQKSFARASRAGAELQRRKELKPFLQQAIRALQSSDATPSPDRKALAAGDELAAGLR